MTISILRRFLVVSLVGLQCAIVLFFLSYSLTFFFLFFFKAIQYSGRILNCFKGTTKRKLVKHKL